MVADLDARLGHLEGSVPPSTAAANPASPTVAAGPAATPPTAAPGVVIRGSTSTTPAQEQVTRPPPATLPVPVTPASPSNVGTAPPEEDSAARQGYVLGTLPRDAITPSTPPPGQQAAGPAPMRAVPNTPRARYDAAISMLQNGDFGGARREFESFVNDYPKDALTPSAAYWLAETHYVTQDYETAAALFAKNYQTYGPNATKAPDNLLKMGMSLTQLGQMDRACQTFAELERRHPNAPVPIKQAAVRAKVGASCH